MSYFVTGLPRSRTAWMAAWLGCNHELMNGLESPDEFAEMLGDNGDSDCGLMWLPLRKMYPDAPVLVIDRPIKDVVASLKRLMDVTPYIETLLDISRRKMLLIDNALVVKFDEIDDRLDEIHMHLKGEPMNIERAELFKNMKIELKNIDGNGRSFDAFVRS